MRLLALALPLFIAIGGFAQVRFEPGFYLDNQGMRTEGWIKNTGWKTNPIRIQFRTTEDGPVKKIPLDSLRGFALTDGPRYERHRVRVDRSTDLERALDYDRQPKFSEETVLLRTLAGGAATLYEYHDDEVTRFFFRLAETAPPEALVYKKYLRNDGTLGENKQFRQQLRNALVDCPAVADDTEDLRYQRGPLLRLFGAYNRCVSPDASAFEEGTKRGSISLTPRFGYRFGNIRNASEVAYADLSTVSPGIELEYTFGDEQRRWSVVLEPAYQSVAGTDTTLTLLRSTATELRLTALDLPLLLRRYFYGTADWRFFVNVGAVSTLPFNSAATSTSLSRSTLPNQVPEVTVREIEFYQGLVAGAGVQFGRLNAELRFYPRRNVLWRFNESRADYQSFDLRVGYRLLGR